MAKWGAIHPKGRLRTAGSQGEAAHCCVRRDLLNLKLKAQNLNFGDSVLKLNVIGQIHKILPFILQR
jgi:hypothetical protein